MSQDKYYKGQDIIKLKNIPRIDNIKPALANLPLCDFSPIIPEMRPIKNNPKRIYILTAKQ